MSDNPQIVPAHEAAPQTTITEAFKYPDNWKDYLPDDIKAEASLGVIHDIPSLAKSYVHAQKNIGAGKVSIPGKHATDDDWSNFFKTVGLPEQDKYLSDTPKDKADTEFFKGFKDLAHKAGILPQQANKLLAWYDDLVAKDVAGMKSQSEQKMTAANDALKKEWGMGYKDKMGYVDSVVKELNEKMGDNQFVSMLEETGLGNDPRFAKVMAMVGEMVGEDTFKGGTGAHQNTPSGIAEKISAITGDFQGPYYNANHPGHKAAVEEVLSLNKMLFTV